MMGMWSIGRRNDDIGDGEVPEVGVPGRWEMVGVFGDGEVANVWGLMQGSFNFALEAVVEDFYGDLWHWQYTGEWERTKRLPAHYKGRSSKHTSGEGFPLFAEGD